MFALSTDIWAPAVLGGGSAWINSFTQRFGVAPDVIVDFAFNRAHQPGQPDGTAAAAITCTRVGYRYVDDTNGNWTPVGPNLPAISNKGLLVEEARINGIRNNTMQGAVIGTPGTLPTNWGVINTVGGTVTTTIVGLGTENGIDYIDLQISGTSTASGTYRLGFEVANSIAAANGQAWTSSLFIKQVGGSTANLTNSNIGFMTYDGTSTLLTVYSSSIANLGYSGPLSGNRASTIGKTITDATTAFIRPEFELNITAAGPYNITFRIGWPQTEQGAFVTSPIRTGNFIRNSAAQGGAAGTIGSGGAYPSNWNGFGPTGTSTTIAFGTINGMDYIDVHVIGTPTGNNFNGVFELNSTIPALNGQTWTTSCYIALIAGSMATVANMKLLIGDYNGGSLTVSHPGPNVIPSLTNTLQLFTLTATLNQATTNFTNMLLNAGGITTGTPLDFTLRIAWPQLEMAASASSHMRTGAPNRPADVVTLTNFPAFGSAYTLYGAASAYNLVLISVNDGSNNNRFQVSRSPTQGAQPVLSVGGSNIWAPATANGSWPNGVLGKLAAAFASGDHAFSLNGAPAVTDATAGVPVGLNRVTIGSSSGGGASLDGYLTEAAIWATTRVPNAGLQSGTL